MSLTPAQWCALANETKTPAGRFELVREALENKWITPVLARRLLELGASDVDAEVAQADDIAAQLARGMRSHLKLVASNGETLEGS